jgi:release factor glutamine methyltransferase
LKSTKVIIANFGLFVNVCGIVTSVMTINVWLSKAIKKLESTSVPTARLDAEVLLADELNKDRSWINAHNEYELTIKETRKLNKQIKRRMTHEPLSYIRGKQEFYGRDFTVSPDTLTPRPETETMIELLLKTVDSRQLTVDSELQFIDVGTGSGCIIITTALELVQISNIKHQISFTGLDISEPALEIAKKNAKNLKAKAKFKQFDLLADSLSVIINPKMNNVILANLPYVPNYYHINLAASHEPGFAIFGGKDGLDYYRLLFKKASENTKLVLTESLPPQHSELINIAKEAGYKVIDSQDLIHVFSR